MFKRLFASLIVATTACLVIGTIEQPPKPLHASPESPATTSTTPVTTAKQQDAGETSAVDSEADLYAVPSGAAIDSAGDATANPPAEFSPIVAQRLNDFRTAVSQNCMGWFCEKYGLGDFEFAAKDQMELYRAVAAKLPSVSTNGVTDPAEVAEIKRRADKILGMYDKKADEVAGLQSEILAYRYGDKLPERIQKQQLSITEQMLAENNRIRAAAGKPPQQLDQRLCQAAQNQADYCARTGAFDHYVNGNPRKRAASFGFPIQHENDLNSVKEILAGNFSNIPNAFSGWQQSSGHYATMLEDRPLCGFGVARGGFGNVWCAVYGREHPQVASEPVQHPPTATEQSKGQQEPAPMTELEFAQFQNALLRRQVAFLKQQIVELGGVPRPTPIDATDPQKYAPPAKVPAQAPQPFQAPSGYHQVVRTGPFGRRQLQWVSDGSQQPVYSSCASSGGCAGGGIFGRRGR